MENDFVKYLFLFVVGILGVFIGRRMAVRKMMKKKFSSDKKDVV